MDQNPVPGWYPDPVGDHDVRWWDGLAWTETVRTGSFQGTAALAPVPVPAEETVLWHRGEEMFTTHRAILREGRRPVDVPWWAVRGAEARGKDLVLRIGYQGYTDKTERRLRGLPNAPELAAVAVAWARRHHRLHTQG